MSIFMLVCLTFRVSDSVEKNRCQLQKIIDRIRLAQARVDKIKGSKKATKVRQYIFTYRMFIRDIIRGQDV